LIKTRFFAFKCLTKPLQEILSRQDAKAQRKISSYFSELGVLCVFARVILSDSVIQKQRKFHICLASFSLEDKSGVDAILSLALNHQWA
jgi:hypothetical protein